MEAVVIGREEATPWIRRREERKEVGRERDLAEREEREEVVVVTRVERGERERSPDRDRGTVFAGLLPTFEFRQRILEGGEPGTDEPTSSGSGPGRDTTNFKC